jgi:hypothetical protein
VITPLLTALMLWSNQLANSSVPFLLLTLGSAAIGGLLLASYLPVAGRGLELGCTPCAVMSGVTVIGGAVAMHTYGGSLLAPLGAAVIMAFGLTQRLGQPTTCATRPAAVRPEETDAARPAGHS